MAWVILVISGLFEIVWAYAMKQSHGFTRLWPSAIAVGGVILSLGLLSWSMRTLPLGTAYMVWTGIGTIGSLVLGEAASPMRLVAALLILSGLVLMKLATP